MHVGSVRIYSRLFSNMNSVFSFLHRYVRVTFRQNIIATEHTAVLRAQKVSNTRVSVCVCVKLYISDARISEYCILESKFIKTSQYFHISIGCDRNSFSNFGRMSHGKLRENTRVAWRLKNQQTSAMVIVYSIRALQERGARYVENKIIDRRCRSIVCVLNLC